MVVCAVLIFDDQNRVLLTQRADDSTWCVPGGSMELGETPEEAAKRECYEETGIIVNDLKLINVISGENSHFTYPNGDEVYAVDIYYACHSFSGTLKNQEEEVIQAKFFEKANLPKELSENDKVILSGFWNNEC